MSKLFNSAFFCSHINRGTSSFAVTVSIRSNGMFDFVEQVLDKYKLGMF